MVVVTFIDIFRIVYIRNHIIQAIGTISKIESPEVIPLKDEEPFGRQKKDDHQPTPKYIKGKDLIKLSPMTLLTRYGMPWSFIKSYLPDTSTLLDDVDLHSRCLMINGYCQHRNAKLDSLCHLLQWSPDFKLHRDTISHVLESGHLDIMLHLVKVYPQDVHIDETSLDKATESGNLELVRWLYEHYTTQKWDNNALMIACQRGYFEIVKWLYTLNRLEISLDIKKKAIDKAVEKGYIDIVEYLYQQGDISQESNLCSIEAINKAAVNGHLNVIKFIHEKQINNNNNQRTQTALDSAAHIHLDILQYLYDVDSSIGFTKLGMDKAAQAGRLDIVKWLHLNSSKGCTMRAMDWAAEANHFEIVKFLDQHRTEGCSEDAFNWSAKNGHLDVLSYLFQHRPERRSIDLMLIDDIAKNGHLIILEFLKENGISMKSLDGLEFAAMKGYMDIVQFILLNTPNQFRYGAALERAGAIGHLELMKLLNELIEGEDDMTKYSPAFIEQAARAGQLESVKFLHSKGYATTYYVIDDACLYGQEEVAKFLMDNNPDVHCTTFAMDQAAKNGHLNIIKFLHERVPHVGCSFYAMAYAAQRGDLEMVRFLHENRTEETSAMAMDLAAENGHLEVVKYLHENRTEGCTEGGLRKALDNGYLFVAQFLYHNRPEVNPNIAKSNNNSLKSYFKNLFFSSTKKKK